SEGEADRASDFEAGCRNLLLLTSAAELGGLFAPSLAHASQLGFDPDALNRRRPGIPARTAPMPRLGLTANLPSSAPTPRTRPGAQPGSLESSAPLSRLH